MLDLREIRSLLFVPGNRPERLAKAAAAGADCVCIDLEDAVPPDARESARAAVLAHLSACPEGHRFGLRINALTSDDGARDLQALTQHAHRAARAAQPAFVMLAKTETAAQLQSTAAASPGTPLIALIETAAGVHEARHIAQAHAQLQALMLGGADLAAELGCQMSWEPLLMARSTLVLAAASARLACIDVPFLDVADAPGCQAEAQRVAALGYSAKALIHPSQVGPVHAGLAPAPEVLAQAQRLLAATSSGAGQVGAVMVEGRMVDRPVLLAAQRVLRRAGIRG